MPELSGPLADAVTQGVGSYGVLAILVLMILESACVPVPSEAIMLYGGVLVGRGETDLATVVAAGVAGNLIGSWIAYGLGRAKGRAWLVRWRWLHVTPRRLAQADAWFDRHGDRAVLISRCLPIVRTFISLPAGIARMPFGRFSVLTAVGCVPWVTALAAGGWAAGEHWEEVQARLHLLDYALLTALAAAAGWWLVRRRTRVVIRVQEGE